MRARLSTSQAGGLGPRPKARLVSANMGMRRKKTKRMRRNSAMLMWVWTRFGAAQAVEGVPKRNCEVSHIPFPLAFRPPAPASSTVCPNVHGMWINLGSISRPGGDVQDSRQGAASLRRPQSPLGHTQKTTSSGHGRPMSARLTTCAASAAVSLTA